MPANPLEWQSLARKNRNTRDLCIEFDEPTHRYTVNGTSNGWISCTGFLHTFFPHFDADLIITRMMSGKSWKSGHKYWGLTVSEIKDLWNSKRDDAAGAGTQLHYEIECFMNSNVLRFEYTHLELLQQHNILIKYDKRYFDEEI